MSTKTDAGRRSGSRGNNAPILARFGERAGIVFACLLTLTACPKSGSSAENEEFDLTSQPAWRANAYPDPVFAAGQQRKQGLWNDPHVLKIGDQYVMYMASSIEQPFQPPIVPFRATSPDGITWTLDPAEPLLSAEGTRFQNLETPSVVRFDDEYHMYYTGVYEEGQVPWMAIGHAVSADGIKWQDKGTILEATGDVEDWNGFLVAEPGAVVYRGRIYLYFTAIATRPGGKPPQLQTIGLASSEDGYEFDTPRLVLSQSESYPPELGFVGYSTPSALVLNGRIHLFHDVAAFIAGGNPEWRQVALQHAVSDDGKTNFVQDDKPLLVQKDFHFTSGEILGPTALVDGDRVRLWFSGHVTYSELAPFVARGYRGNEFGIGHAHVSLESFLADPN